jgi:trigger factor
MPRIAVKNYKGIEVERIKNVPSAKKAEMLMKDAIIDKILQVNDLEVPQDWVANEVTKMVIELKHREKYESMSFTGGIEITQEDMADHIEELREEAFKLVKARLVLKGIIDAENFEVSKEELEEEAKVISERQQTPLSMVKDFFGEDLESLKADLLIRKAMDFVYANAIIK